MARIDPSASPSGFSCVTRRKRSWPRIASGTWARSVVGVVLIVRVGWFGWGWFGWGWFGGEVVDQLRQPHTSLDRRIVFEGELRGPLELQLVRDRGLEDAVRRREAAKRRVPLALAAEDADVDDGVAEVGGGGHAGHGDEADARVLELGNGLRQHLSDRLVHSAHAVTHRGSRSPSPPGRAPTPGRGGSARRRRGAARARSGRARRTRP